MKIYADCVSGARDKTNTNSLTWVKANKQTDWQIRAEFPNQFELIFENGETTYTYSLRRFEFPIRMD